MLALRTHGVPEAILTDNGKVFTARFGRGPGPVLFDRICAENGVRHLLTAPYSPTTTGKVERFHKTLRAGWGRPNERVFATLELAPASLDAWVIEYNTARPHQSIGNRPPAERFSLAAVRAVEITEQEPARPGAGRAPRVSRWVDQGGMISMAGFKYRSGTRSPVSTWRSSWSTGWSRSGTTGRWSPPMRSGCGPTSSAVDQFAADALQSAGNLHFARLEIDHWPGQPEDLTAAQSRDQDEHDGRGDFQPLLRRSQHALRGTKTVRCRVRRTACAGSRCRRGARRPGRPRACVPRR